MPVEQPPAIYSTAPESVGNGDLMVSPSLSSSNSNQSNSESRSQINQAPQMSNVQVNNSNSSEFSFAPGVYAPTPNLSFSVYKNDSDTGVVATVSTPLGNQTSESFNRMIEGKLKRQAFENSVSLLETCAKIKASGTIVDYKQFPELSRCQAVVVVKSTNHIQLKTSVDSSLRINNAELEKLKIENLQLRMKLDTSNSPVKGKW